MSVVIDNKEYEIGDKIFGGTVVDELEIVGMEYKRSDVAQFSRNLQQKVFDMLLRQDKPRDEVLRYIGDEIDRLRKGESTFTEIGIPKGITKDLDKYEHPSSNIRGAIYASKVLDQELTGKPKLIYVSKMPNNYPPTDVICFDEDKQIPAGTEIDIEKMLVKLVKDKLESIFEALGWKISDLVYYWKGKAPKAGAQEMLFSLKEFDENPKNPLK